MWTLAKVDGSGIATFLQVSAFPAGSWTLAKVDGSSIAAFAVTASYGEWTLAKVSGGSIVYTDGIVDPTLPSWVLRKVSGASADYISAAVGPVGPTSQPEVIHVNFSYGDAPSQVWSPQAACLLLEARLTIRTAFDSITSKIASGRSFAGSEILADTDSNPYDGGTYDIPVDIFLSLGDPVWLSITPAGATVGSGTLTLYLSYNIP